MSIFQRKELTMKWAGLYLVGFIVLIGGGLAALYKLGLLQNVSTSWIVIGVVILLGIGIMAAVANSGMKENISIDRR
jgi:drug/metabolite transporter (DMT)-like permease